MKTEQILDISCKTETNRKKLCNMLFHIKPLKRIAKEHGYEKGTILPLDVLTETFHGICGRYNYKHQGITEYYEDGKFCMYCVSLLVRKDGTNQWIGNIYGESLWEVYAKMLFKVYADILKSKNQEE